MLEMMKICLKLPEITLNRLKTKSSIGTTLKKLSLEQYVRTPSCQISSAVPKLSTNKTSLVDMTKNPDLSSDGGNFCKTR